MTKTLLKNTFREIANSKARFISILAIIALGVGFFAGIKATVPSMYNMADEYYSQSNLMDYRLVSTVGFDKDDVKAVENLDNVTDVMPSYFADLVLKSNGNGGNGKVIRVTAVKQVLETVSAFEIEGAFLINQHCQIDLCSSLLKNSLDT